MLRILVLNTDLSQKLYRKWKPYYMPCVDTITLHPFSLKLDRQPTKIKCDSRNFSAVTLLRSLSTDGSL